MERRLFAEVTGGDELGLGRVCAIVEPIRLDRGRETVEVGSFSVFLALVGDAAYSEDRDGGENAEDDDDDEEFNECEPISSFVLSGLLR